MLRRILPLTIGGYLASLFLLAGQAVAAATSPQHTLALPTDQVWALLAGALAPLAAYVLNYIGPHSSEKIKALVHIVVAAIAGGIAQAIDAGGVGLNTVTLQFVVTAVIAALGAHKLLYLPSTISTALGGGRDAHARPARR